MQELKEVESPTPRRQKKHLDQGEKNYSTAGGQKRSQLKSSITAARE